MIINLKERKMKSLEEFVALFAEQFDDTDSNEIQASTVFHDLDEWSSNCSANRATNSSKLFIFLSFKFIIM